MPADLIQEVKFVAVQTSLFELTGNVFPKAITLRSCAKSMVFRVYLLQHKNPLKSEIVGNPMVFIVLAFGNEVP